ncbi:hypothetical protein J22TS1_01360 [Siminovitchia terrae]|nr:hypothetical protein J22TS1_01360 [Siminovitchia terrae]
MIDEGSWNRRDNEGNHPVTSEVVAEVEKDLLKKIRKWDMKGSIRYIMIGAEERQDVRVFKPIHT